MKIIITIRLPLRYRPGPAYYLSMIVHTGEALIDFIPVREATGKLAFQPVPGGSPYNTSVAAARLEVPNAFLGRISSDFFGDQLVSYLEDNGVRTDMITRDDALSTLAFVKRLDSGAARYAFFTKGSADRNFSPSDIPALHAEVAALQFGSISLIGDPAGDTIVSLVEREREDRVISFDPNIRESLIIDAPAYRSRIERAVAASTVVKVSDEDLAWMTGDSDIRSGAMELLKKGPLLVVVTEGDRGSSAFMPDLMARADAERTTVNDTVGAGDSFHAALLAWCYHSDVLKREKIAALQKSDLEVMLRFAGAVAAKTCSRAGANPPRLSEIQTRFRSW